MPAVGFGTSRLRGKECERSVAAALNAGFRMIDTAIAYGNERSIGRAIRMSGLPRESIFVTSKLLGSEGYADGIGAVHGSLERLGMDYLDLYLMHLPIDGSLAGTWQAMQTAWQSGLVRAIGVSNFSIDQLQVLGDLGGELPTVNQIELNPWRRQLAIQSFCRNANIQIVAWAPLMHGTPLREVSAISEIAERRRKSVAQIILRWHLQSNLVPIPSTSSFEHMKQNLDIFDFVLDDSEMNSIDILDSSSDSNPHQILLTPRSFASG
ncbi:aldo/keto reductase [Nocardia amamiensis]|uniref:aldo/keto reductase n=1 Tax=Nocardia amamiensis TaxID=404578 RepID=UPI0033F366B6